MPRDIMSKYDKKFAVGDTFFVMRIDSSIEDLVIDQHTAASIVPGAWPSDAKIFTAAGKSFALMAAHATREEAEAERANWINEQAAVIFGRSQQLKRLMDKLTTRGEWPYLPPVPDELPHTL